MLYSFVRPLATIGIYIFYRKVYLSNAHLIPKNKPVILAANHPTGFMEPCILACYLDRPLYFLVRGDLFKKPVYKKLLHWLHMLPVYRVKDGGFSVLKNNFETFDYCYDALKQQKTLMILAEGSAEHEKRLRPLKKGTARVALGTLDRYTDLEEVYIVPTGVNYTYAEKPRSEVMIDFGAPIRASDFMAAYRENPNQGIADLTEALANKLKERIVIIERKEDEALTEHLLLLSRNDEQCVFPILNRSHSFLEKEKRIANAVNKIPVSQRAELLQKTNLYFNKLKDKGLGRDVFAAKKQSRVGAIIFLVLGLLPFVAAALLSYLPLKIAKNITQKRVRRVEFYAPVLWAVSLGTYLIYALLWLLLAILLKSWLLFGILAILPILTYFAILYKEIYKNWKEDRILRALSPLEKEKLQAARAAAWASFQQWNEAQASA